MKKINNCPYSFVKEQAYKILMFINYYFLNTIVLINKLFKKSNYFQGHWNLLNSNKKFMQFTCFFFRHVGGVCVCVYE